MIVPVVIAASVALAAVNLVWDVEIGEGYSGPAVADGRVFVFDRAGAVERLTAHDAKTGARLWRSTAPTTYEDMYGFGNGPRAAPVVDGDRVYTHGAGGRLRCQKVADGGIVWEIDTSAKFGVVQNFFGVGSAPAVEGDLLIVGVGGSPKGSPGIMSGKVAGNGSGIVAFDKRTGEVRYSISDELASYSTPVFATIGDRRWGFHLARGGLIGFEPSKGGIDFFYPFRAKKLESVNAGNPVVVGDTVFITESYGVGSAVLRVRPGGYEVVRKDVRGATQAMSCHFMTPVVIDGIMYGSSGQSTGNAELRAVDYDTGTIRWRKDGLGRATVLAVDGRLVVLTEHGRLLLIRATPERFELLSEATVFEYPAWSAPVRSDGLIFARGKKRLAAFRLDESARSFGQ